MFAKRAEKIRKLKKEQKKQRYIIIGLFTLILYGGAQLTSSTYAFFSDQSKTSGVISTARMFPKYANELAEKVKGNSSESATQLIKINEVLKSENKSVKEIETAIGSAKKMTVQMSEIEKAAIASIQILQRNLDLETIDFKNKIQGSETVRRYIEEALKMAKNELKKIHHDMKEANKNIQTAEKELKQKIQQEKQQAEEAKKKAAEEEAKKKHAEQEAKKKEEEAKKKQAEEEAKKKTEKDKKVSEDKGSTTDDPPSTNEVAEEDKQDNNGNEASKLPDSSSSEQSKEGQK
ncbi:hypothetical protein KUV80_11115 [Fictibacillus nanhaiensis]|uniref:hypothetical protein n=1 Tax=Fictibacillus nanhaiensis TaxID=742169 RepID=UPI001C9729A5|nr:hypothetical protein [Fictibacillus nanhaiensis]MBY6037209.1 hypothetical protein [Fictibacillus nanhaiensis]